MLLEIFDSSFVVSYKVDVFTVLVEPLLSLRLEQMIVFVFAIFLLRSRLLRGLIVERTVVVQVFKSLANI
jgi:hypothetical protein